MKFKSRKDILFQMMIFGISGLFLGIFLITLFSRERDLLSYIWIDIIMLLMIGLLLWIYFKTEYVLTASKLIYKSGPLRGSIEIHRIREIIKYKTLWSGLKPATARNGLIIKYDKFEEIYISPETNETFIKRILELNDKIKITSKRN